MNSAEYKTKEIPGGVTSAGDVPANSNELHKTIELGRQVAGFVVDLADIARMEAMLAAKVMPRVLLLWLAMVPIILLAWCSFAACIGWAVYSLTESLGAGLFVFFLQQMLLLLLCHLLQRKSKAQMAMPYTRNHLNNFLKGFSNEAGDQASAKKL